MGSSYKIYNLSVPSGGTVRVRRLGLVGRLACGTVGAGLVRAAMGAIATAKADTTATKLKDIEKVVRFAMFLDVALPWYDTMAVAAFAMSDIQSEQPADLVGTGLWSTQDMIPIVTGHGALLVDGYCQRYSCRPSEVVGISQCEFATEFDLSCAIRGSHRDSDSTTADGRGEVDAQDMWGNTVRLPASVLVPPPGPQDRVMAADDLARHYGPVSFLAGGAPDGALSGRAIQ